MRSIQHITFIINPISGTQSKHEIPDLIDRMMDKERFECKVCITEYAGHAAELAKACAAQGDDIVVAVGGDGTVNEVARSLVHTKTALGIIPCGSGNGLARHLCIPMDIRKALDIINQAQIVDFDYGVINDLPFFCTCGMGFDAFISLKFAEAGKRGPITYVENVLKEGLKYKPETYEIIDDNGTTKYKAFLIACANASQYGNNAYIAPGATMKDGKMDVIIMEPFDALEAPQIAADLFMKTLGNNSKIKTFRTRKLTIHRQSPGAIHYDGDPIMTNSDIEVHIEHLGIRIVANPDIPEDKAEPNMVLNAFSDFFNNINNVREDIGKDLERSGRRIQAINKVLLRKLRY
ncbi:MAG: YegS/Rv2252/BmrU family lipid kinase [Prevotella sp.]|jgi:YegS/Rv2252/BmrU family lipid kinase|nr:YegS/Rv2252/BmrU family lipid kinase [Prevotella sp.]MBQ5496885.1 YegS/Rv2252/BmrU family lipid kinase [Prevotella sp.]